MKKIISMLALSSFFLIGSAMAMDKATMDHSTMDHSKMESMDNSKMDHGASQESGTFKEAVMVDGIHAEFQVMDLASMNMTDPEGRTHHIMASFMKNDAKITDVVGKVKLISPSGKEQLGDLKNVGSGVFATNFTISI